ncbi:MAG: AbiV family abortive infection protein [Actinomycetota bacterium]
MEELQALFNKYNGKLTLEQISKGICSCIENALNIFADAYILKKAKRFPRASSLFLTAMQEAGKVNILKNMLTISPENQKRWKKEWQNFRRHEIKDSLGQSVEISSEFNNSPGEAFWQQLLYAKYLAPAREKIRQLGFYVDYAADDKKWWSPNEITEEMVGTIESEVVKILFRLKKEEELGLFSIKALKISQEEFKDFCPKIDFNKEYEINDFGSRFFGVKGPYRKYWSRIINEGVINEIPDGFTIAGECWEKFILNEKS